MFKLAGAFIAATGRAPASPSPDAGSQDLPTVKIAVESSRIGEFVERGFPFLLRPIRNRNPHAAQTLRASVKSFLGPPRNPRAIYQSVYYSSQAK